MEIIRWKDLDFTEYNGAPEKWEKEEMQRPGG
jgi:hypothetical protein